MFPTLLIRRGKTANGITCSHSNSQLILAFLGLKQYYLALDYEGSVNCGDINSFMHIYIHVYSLYTPVYNNVFYTLASSTKE